MQPNNEVDLASSAFLTPEHIATIAGIKNQRDLIEQKKISEVMDMMYKLRGDPLDQPSTIQYPGLQRPLTIREWDNLPPDNKAYALFVETSKNIGDPNPMSKEEYDALKPTEKERFLRSAMKDPKLMKAAKEVAEASRINISLGTKLEEKKKMSELEGQLYFNDPKWSETLEKDTANYAKDTLWNINPGQRDKEITKYKAKLIEGKIIAGGGSITNAYIDKDGRTGVWKVEWPNGDTKIIKYKIK